MRHAHPLRLATQQGFTLIESVIALVLLAIASVAIVSLQGSIFSGQSDNKNLEVGVQLMQECAEQILAKRHKTSGTQSTADYLLVANSLCTGLGNFGGFGAPSVTLKDASNATVTTCASATCTATISISNGATTLTAITLRLANY